MWTRGEGEYKLNHLIGIDKDSFFHEFIAWFLKKEEEIREIGDDVNHILVIEPVVSHHQQFPTKARLNTERVLLNVEVSLVACRRGLERTGAPIYFLALRRL